MWEDGICASVSFKHCSTEGWMVWVLYLKSIDISASTYLLAHPLVYMLEYWIFRDAHSEVERAAANVQHLQTCVAERDDELAIRSKEVTNLNAELIQLPEIQQAANRMQEQLDDIIPKYHAMEQEISSRDGRIQELESRAVFVDELQRELGTRDELISSHSEEIAKLEAEKQQVSLELEDAGRRLGEMEGEMNEAFEIAELADSESQKANAACAEMEEQLRVAHQNVAELEGSD